MVEQLKWLTLALIGSFSSPLGARLLKILYRPATPLSGISRSISCRRNQEMGRPDQGKWRFILIAVDRMRFTCPCCPYPAHFARCAMHEIDELWLAPVWRQAGSFRMRRFVYTEG